MGSFRDMQSAPAGKGAGGGTYRRLDAPKPKATLVDDLIGGAKAFENVIPGLDEVTDTIRVKVKTAADIFSPGFSAEVRARAKDPKRGNPLDVVKETEARNWKAEREGRKASVQGFGERHPVLKPLTEGLGMAATSIPAFLTGGAALLPSAAPAAAPAAGGLLAGLKTLLGASAKGGTVGGLSGGLAGLLGEGDLAQRAEDTNRGAVLGGAVGAALPPALMAGAQAVNAGSRAFLPQEQKLAAQAGRILAARAPAAAEPLPRWNANVLPFERMGRGGESLARAVAAVPGPGQDIAEQVLRTRQGEAPGRMMATTIRDLGDGGTSFHPTLDQLDMKRLVESKPLYEQAWAKGPVQSTRLDDLARRPSIKDAIKKAFRLAMEEGEDAKGLGLFDLDNMDDWVSEAPPTGAVVAGAEKAAARGGLAKAPQGKSLIKYLADGGGIRDDGGELWARDANLWNKGKAYQRRLIGDGDTADGWAERAWEQGYFPQFQERPGPQDLIDAIEDELRGRPRYARPADPRAADRVRMLDEAEEMAYRGGDADDLPHPDQYVGRPEPRREPVFDGVPTAKTWDYVKRALDELIEEKRDPVTKRLPRTDTMRLMDETRRDLRGELVNQNPAYGPALAAYSGPSRAIDAMHLGRRLAGGRMDAEDVAEGLSKMSKNELDGLRLGLARGLADMFRGENPQRVVKRFATDQVVQDRLRAGFNDDVAYGRFMDDVIAEAEAQQSYNRVLAGSRTTPLAQDIAAANDAAMSGAERAVDVVAKRMGGQSLRSQAVVAAIQNWERVRQPGLNNPEVSRLLADALFKSGDPEALLRAMITSKVITPQEVEAVLPLLATYEGQASPRLQARP